MICQLDTESLEIRGNKVTSSRHNWTEYDVQIDSLLTVFGMGVFQGRLRFLIDLSDNSRPLWFDATDFKIVTSDIPRNWESASFADGDWSFIFGYENLVKSDEHFNGLLEREEHDLEIFQNLKEIYKNEHASLL